MKIIRIILVLITSLCFLGGCQKQLTFEANGVSAGTFKKDAAGGCLPVYINSNFYVDTVLTNLDYVDVQVEVSVAGDFDIRSDTINGYSFRKTGTTYPGLNTIRLYPTGKPVSGGLNTFTIKYGTSTCTFDINVLSLGPPSAVFTLGGAGGNCTGVVVNGTYTAGSALTSSNTVQMDVNVTATGVYVVSTTAVNGASFITTGTFTTTGPQTVTLVGSGTPVAAGTFVFLTTGNASTCSFQVIVN
jgi:hypothetical protein